jgi:hypothetical protein
VQIVSRSILAINFGIAPNAEMPWVLVVRIQPCPSLLPRLASPIVVGSINAFGGRFFGVISIETLQPSEMVCGGFVAADYAFCAKVSESHPLTTCRKLQ